MRAQSVAFVGVLALVVGSSSAASDLDAAHGSVAPFGVYARPLDWHHSAFRSVASASPTWALAVPTKAPSPMEDSQGEIEVWVGPASPVLATTLPVCSILVLNAPADVDAKMVHDVTTDVDPRFTRRSACADEASR